MTHNQPRDTIEGERRRLRSFRDSKFGVWVVEPIVAGGAAGEAVVQTTMELVPIYTSAVPQLTLYHLERCFRAS